MTNQQFKDLLESNGIKTREHQFFDFCFGNFSVVKLEGIRDEVCIYYENINLSIYFDDVEIREGLVFFKNKGNTISIITIGEFI